MTETKEILAMFGIYAPERVEQIYKSAWSIDDKYILKTNSDKAQLDKSILLSDLLIKEKTPVPEFLTAPDGKRYVQIDDVYYTLMEKIDGHYLDPYADVPYENGIMLGELVADLHLALGKIGDEFECYDADYMNELDDWILKRIKENNVQISQEIIDYCYSFGPLYRTLPRQLIHRDVHMWNLLFNGRDFCGYLDFDNSQKNVRLHDLCYLGANLLVDNYQDQSRVTIWRDIFRGVLEGYSSVFELTENEIKAIPYMFVFIELTFAAAYAPQGQHELSVDMTKWFYRNRDTF
ncbi:MAG: phosphotransferase [Oscillospiraceae bacterium]|nr:phosphotransferase [Oscillospiraceae bacterium]